MHKLSRMGEGFYFPLCVLLAYIKKKWSADSVEKTVYRYSCSSVFDKKHAFSFLFLFI